MIALIADLVPENEVQKLKEHLNKIRHIPLQQKISWVKENMPTSAKIAFRTFYNNKIKIKDHYDPFKPSV